MSAKRMVSAVLLLGIAAGLRAADTYQIDPVHSAFLFRIKHMNISYSYGRFNSSTGQIAIDEDPAKCGVNIEVKADSVDTADAKRDQHLKGPDFFNAKQFPTISFKSKAVKKEGAGYEVTG